MTYEVSVEVGFSARHQVRMPDGELEEPHSHDWRAKVTYAGQQLDSAGILVDFIEVKRQLENAVEDFDQADLNACPALGGQNPTAEHVAKLVFDRLAGVDSRFADLLKQVSVVEAPGCTATYRRSVTAG